MVEDHTGQEIFRCGGKWDRYTQRYVEGKVEPHVVRLQESQREIAVSFAAWLEKKRAAAKRGRVIGGGGDRGSGKTWFLSGPCIVAMALEFPGEWQMAVNLTAKQRRECIVSIEAASRPEWIADQVDDHREPMTIFVTGNTVQWLSGRNPEALRQAGLRICHVFINEGQSQPEIVFLNGIAAIRNTGGLLTFASNRPQKDAGDWVALIWLGIEAGELNGVVHELDPKKNRAIDQDAQEDIKAFLYAVNREAADADMGGGGFRLAGPVAYPAFRPTSWTLGGHVGKPDVGLTDVTRLLSASAMESQIGFDYVVGVDFQREPGIIGTLAKLYRDGNGTLYLYCVDTLGVAGVEGDFSQALVAAGYSSTGIHPVTGEKCPSVLLVGDGTGARQNAEHRKGQPTSFMALRADGWKIVPPMYHWRHRTPWNPLVRESRAQMHMLLSARQVLFSEKCREPGNGFPSLVESMRRAKVGPRGGLLENGGYQHGPDGVRYLAWRFLPRPKPEQPSGVDRDTYDSITSIKGFGD